MSTEKLQEVEQVTGALYSDLWGPYQTQLFDESVQLFEKRLRLANVDPRSFEGKICLDAGCGGGRNSIAMARLGAARVTGVDIGEKGLEDARRRAGDLANIEFKHGSLLDLPFADSSFDMVWCAGVVMHTADPERALDQLARVVKPGGRLYLLVYATEGLRWPLIQLLRPLGQQIGRAGLEKAIELANLPANKRRTFLDDLLVPCIDFFRWDRLESALIRRGFTGLTRWGTAPRLDHEQSLEAYRSDLESLLQLFEGGKEGALAHKDLFVTASAITAATITTIRWFEAQVASNAMSPETAMQRVIGQGHHRLICTRSER